MNTFQRVEEIESVRRFWLVETWFAHYDCTRCLELNVQEPKDAKALNAHAPDDVGTAKTHVADTNATAVNPTGTVLRKKKSAFGGGAAKKRTSRARGNPQPS